MEGLATNITGWIIRGLTLAKECALEGNTRDETEYVGSGRSRRTNGWCTVKRLAANETERSVMAISAAVT